MEVAAQSLLSCTAHPCSSEEPLLLGRQTYWSAALYAARDEPTGMIKRACSSPALPATGTVFIELPLCTCVQHKLTTAHPCSSEEPLLLGRRSCWPAASEAARDEPPPPGMVKRASSSPGWPAEARLRPGLCARTLAARKARGRCLCSVPASETAAPQHGAIVRGQQCSHCCLLCCSQLVQVHTLLALTMRAPQSLFGALLSLPSVSAAA